MKPRISVVKNIKINTVIFSSVFQVGDSKVLTPRSWILAVQREFPEYFGHEGDFRLYSIYREKIPIPTYEMINMKTINKSPYINVNNIRIIGMSVSGITQIGSNHTIDAESRIKHIRHFLIPLEEPYP